MHLGEIPDIYVAKAINQLAPAWDNTTYNLISRNCQDFVTAVWSLARELVYADKPIIEEPKTVTRDAKNVKD